MSLGVCEECGHEGDREYVECCNALVCYACATTHDDCYDPFKGLEDCEDD